MDASSPANKTQFVRHRGPVTGVELIPGTQTAVTSAYDGAVALFDLATRQVELLGYHRHLVNRIVVDQQGHLAASCSSDYSVHLWDLQAGKYLGQLLGHSDDVEDFVFAEEGLGVSASRDRRILVWDLETGAVRRVLEGHEKDVLALAYHEGKIYSSGDDMTLRVWDLDSGELLNTWGPFENETDTCAIDPLHQRAILGCDDGCIRIFDTASGRLVRTIEAHSSGIKKVAVSPANGDILSAAYDQAIRIWDSETLEERRSLEKRPSTWERSLTWTPDGARILGGSFDGTVFVWDAVTGGFELQVGEQQDEPGNACFNEVSATDDGLLALVSDDGYVRLGRLSPEASSWETKVEPASGRMLMNAVTLDRPSGLVVAGAHNHAVHIFTLRGAELSDEVAVALGEGPINTVRIAHQPGYEDEAFVGCYSSVIARVGRDGGIRGKIRVHEGAVKSLRLHPEKPLGVSCGADGLLLSWSFEGELLERYLGHTAIINDVDLDPSGTWLASVSRDFTLKVFTLENGRLRHSIPLGRRSLKSVCICDEKTVLVGDYWGSVIRVDLESERATRVVVATNGISSLTRRGDSVVAVSYDGSVSQIDPADLSVRNTLRAMTQRLDLGLAA